MHKAIRPCRQQCIPSPQFCPYITKWVFQNACPEKDRLAKIHKTGPEKEPSLLVSLFPPQPRPGGPMSEAEGRRGLKG